MTHTSPSIDEEFRSRLVTQTLTIQRRGREYMRERETVRAIDAATHPQQVREILHLDALREAFARECETDQDLAEAAYRIHDRYQHHARGPAVVPNTYTHNPYARAGEDAYQSYPAQSPNTRTLQRESTRHR